MDTTHTLARSWLRRLALLPALLLWLATAAIAQTAANPDADPPGRVATLTQQLGSVVFAPDGEDEWIDLPLNRPLTRGDRVWTDRGARAELHMGATTLHLDGQSHLAFFELDDDEAQLSLTQGTVNVRVRDLQPRENVEVDTPNLAVRAAGVGDYRVDVDAQDGTTRVIVRSGEVIVYGQGGESLRLQGGQQATFEDRNLWQVRGRITGTDDFDQWAADLNRREDQSVSARYIPRSVIGYQELDSHGTWDSHTEYGPVWYPRVVANDWAPYRYGRWSYIRPWGWTWIDEAPWGFAPFHYGRWALIGSRWAWVPGHFGPRPVYAPALVAFVGGGSGVSISFNIGSGPGIGWYPLAPGEAWYPTYRTTNIYLSNINRNIQVRRDPRYVHVHRHRADAWTSVRVEDFNRGRRVRDHWRPVRPNDLANAPVATLLPPPDREGRGGRGDRERASRLVAPPPAAKPTLSSRILTEMNREQRQDQRQEQRRDARDERRDDRRDAREERRDDRRDDRPIRGEEPRRPPVRDDARIEDNRRQSQERLREQMEQRDRQAQEQRAREEQARQQAERQQERMQREQERAQREQERERREQAVRQQQEQQQRAQREQAVRQQQEQQRAQREQERAQREQSMRQQQQERMQRDQERAQREQAVRQQQEQQRAQREQAARQQQEQRVQRQQQQQEERQQRQQQRQQRDDDEERRGRGRNG